MIKKSMATAIAICAIFTASVAFAQSGNPGDAAKKHPFIFQDNSVRWEWGEQFRAPFISLGTCTYQATYTCPAANQTQNILGLTHVDSGNKLGDNYIDVFLRDISRADPVSVAHFHNNDLSGSKAYWTTINHELIIDRLVNKNLGVGFVKNWFIEIGAMLGAKTDDFGSQIRKPMIGPGVNIKLPNNGRWKIAATWTREWNIEGTDVTSYYYQAKAGPNAGIISSNGNICTIPHACAPIPATWGEPVVYSPREFTFMTSWAYPIVKLGKAPLLFSGSSILNTAKGYGAPQLIAFTGANAPSWGPSSTPVWYKSGSRPESLTHARIMYNVGSLFGEGHNWQIGGGYEYWHNEFGVGQRVPLPTNLFGTTGQVGGAGGTSECTSCIESVPFVSIEIHL